MTADLFVYGTLRRACGHPLYALIARHGEYLGDGVIAAVLHDLGEYPGAVPAHEPGATVRGEVYRLRDVARVLAELDRYEGCSPACPPPHEYARREITVRGDDGASWRAWTYLYIADVAARRRIASGDYLADLEAGTAREQDA